MEGMGLYQPCHPIAQTGISMSAVTGCRVFPECAHFVNGWDPMLASGANCRQDVEDRRMGMEDLGTQFADHLIDAPTEVIDNSQFAKPGHPSGRPFWHRRPQKFPVANSLPRWSRRIMLAARQQKRLPAQRPLLVDDPERAIDIAALQRQRMVEYVEDPHRPDRL